MNRLFLVQPLRNPSRLILSTNTPPLFRTPILPTLFHPTTTFRKTTARMCQGCVPEYFEFKQSPTPLPQNWLNSRFLTQATEEKDKDRGTDSFEYRVAHNAPCPIIDAHVHVFPQKLMDAVWTFFDNFYWPVRYKKNYLATRADFLLDQGIRHVVLLVYAHKNGIARDLNKFLAHTVNSMNERYASLPQPNGGQQPKRARVASGLATVMPGEPDARGILAEAFTTLGLSGIKMHSHVQCVAANHPSMDEVYETCIEFDKPVLIHAGKEPNSKAYKVDAGKICDFSIVEDVLRRYPRLRICVPHLGMNQYEEFFDLLDKYPNLYLDTTMTLGAFFQSLNSTTTTTLSSSCSSSTCDHASHTTNNNNINTSTTTTPALKPMTEMLRTMLIRHSDRILYGTDWPNIPYDWCRELANLISLVDGDGEATDVSGERVRKEEHRTRETDEALENILWRNASRFYRISEHDLGLAPLSPNL